MQKALCDSCIIGIINVFVLRLTWLSKSQLVTYTEVAEELNYHSLIFSRFSGRGFSLGTGKESIAYQTTIYGLPMSIYSRAWESGSQTRSLSGTSGLGFQLM